jgi:hypothetical protein
MKRFAVVGTTLLAISVGASTWAQEVLPTPPAPFKGKIAQSIKDSTPDFPQPVHAPQGGTQHPARAAGRRRLRRVERPAGADVDPITGYTWELYNVADDFSEANDLAKQNPEKLAELQKLFYDEAAKYNVLPIDNSKTTRLDPSIRPSLTRGRTSFSYHDGMVRIPEGAVPDVKDKETARAEAETTQQAARAMALRE